MTPVSGKILGRATVSFGQPITCDGQDRGGLAARLENECKSMTVAYPTNIMAAALVKNQDRNEFYETIMDIQKQLKAKGAISEILPAEQIVERAMRFLDAPLRRFFSLKNYEIRRGDIIRYYNNSIAHLLD